MPRGPAENTVDEGDDSSSVSLFGPTEEKPELLDRNCECTEQSTGITVAKVLWPESNLQLRQQRPPRPFVLHIIAPTCRAKYHMIPKIRASRQAVKVLPLRYETQQDIGMKKAGEMKTAHRHPFATPMIFPHMYVVRPHEEACRQQAASAHIWRRSRAQHLHSFRAQIKSLAVPAGLTMRRPPFKRKSKPAKE